MNFYKLLIVKILLLFGGTLSAKSISYEDIINISKPQCVVISLEGSRVAVVLRKGFLEENCNKDKFLLQDIYSGKKEVACVADHILQMVCGKDATTCYFLMEPTIHPTKNL